jgi:hypothetical protein
MHKLIPLMALLIVTPTWADEIFKWVDENGQMHFSDVPRDGATEVELAPAQTFSSQGAPSIAASSDATAKVAARQEVVNYESMEIVSPASEETIWNTGGKVTVTVQLQPGLQTGHQIRLYIDGKPLPNLPPNSSSLQVSDVYRGEHLLKAEVRDENGKVLVTAQPTTFFYQQTSVNRR